jgi:hypothetical protein
MVLHSSGPISFSQIRNELGGPSSIAPISLSQYKTTGTYGSVLASNPNTIPSSNSLIKFSKFYSSSKYNYPSGTYTVTQQLATIGNTINQDPSALQVWVNGDPYQYVYAPIGNYPINFYYIYQNTTGSSLPTTIYAFQDDNLTLSINNSTVANYTYGANTLSTTLNVGQNILKGTVTNTGGPGTFQMTLKNSTGNTLAFTNTTWVADTRCLLHYNNWVSTFTTVNTSGTPPSLTGTDPDKQYQLGFGTGGTTNKIYSTLRIQDYSSFALYFEINIGTGSAADGLFCFIGSTNTNAIIETGGYNSFTLTFQLYTGGGLAQGIYLRNGAGTQVAYYATSGYIASAWQGVYVNYTKGTTNTWIYWWNGINIFNYSDANNATYITNSGSNCGFGFRDGGSVGTASVRHIQLYHRA